MSAAVIEVFRSTRRADCDERAFVLAAIGIAGTIHFDGLQYLLEVEAADLRRALTQLGQYELERAGQRLPPPPPLPGYPYAWVGCIVYVATLIGIGLTVSNGLWRLDAFDIGELDAGRVQAGQWWRAWTALTLHLDGLPIWPPASPPACGFVISRPRRSAVAAPGSLIVTGAACANLLEGLLGPPTHLSVGASTAVFTALGFAGGPFAAAARLVYAALGRTLGATGRWRGAVGMVRQRRRGGCHHGDADRHRRTRGSASSSAASSAPSQRSRTGAADARSRAAMVIGAGGAGIDCDRVGLRPRQLETLDEGDVRLLPSGE